MSYYTREQILNLIGLINDMKLEGRELTRGYNIDELLVICNGIGAEWMDQDAREKISQSLPTLEPGAFLHDIRYHEGGDDEDREYADEEFLRNGLRAAAWKYPWWHYKRYAVRGAAKICYRAVRLGGAAAWGANAK